MLLRDRLLGGVSQAAVMAPETGAGADAPQPAAHEVSQDQGGDDAGLTPDEQAQFDAMRDAPATAAQEEPPPAEGEAQPAAKAEGEDDDDGEDDAPPAEGQAKKPRRVSIAKHERELKARDERIKALEETSRTNAEMQARLDERMKIINEALTPQQKKDQQEEDPEPNAEEDIFAHNAWLKRELVRTQAVIKQMHEGMQQQSDQSGLERAYVSDVQRFSNVQPKFSEGYNYLMQARVSQLALYYFDKDLSAEGVGLTQQELSHIQSVIEDEEQQLVSTALRNRRSPAQVIFNLAKSMGYKPEAAPTNGHTNGAAKNGAAPGSLAARAEEGAKPSVKDEIARIKAGVDASASLSGAGGAAPAPLTLEKLANMPQDQFDELFETLSESQQARLLGGAA